MRIPIEQVEVGDIINGKRVVETLHRTSVQYVRLILEGGRQIIDGYERETMVEVDRRAAEAGR